METQSSQLQHLFGTMSEKLCLRWNDFQENVNSAFGGLKSSGDFSDVTLACEDGQQIEAHRVILAASSPFFQNLLKINKQAYPIIYMKGMKSEDLISIVDFLYCGEANVYQENLDYFLAIAEDLKLKGLMGQKEDQKEMEQNINTGSTSRSMQMNSKPTLKRERENIPFSAKPTFEKHASTSETSNERRMNVLDFDSGGDLLELDAKVKLMMEKSQNLIPSGKKRADICKVCGKEGEGIAIRDHIESNHLEGISLPCNVCGNTFRSRNQLRRHKYTCLDK